MNEELTKELNFLVAKLLQSKYPDIADEFIARCQQENEFPTGIFKDHPSYLELAQSSFKDIPSDHLLGLVNSFHSSSHIPCFLSNIESRNLHHLRRSDALLHKLGSTRSLFDDFVPSVRILGHDNIVFCLAMDETSQVLITGADDFRVKIWHFADDINLISSFNGHASYVSDIQVNPQNTMFATSCHDHSICVFSLTTGELLSRIELPSEIHTIRFSPDSSLLAAALEEGSVRLFGLPQFEELFAFQTPEKKSADWLCFSGGGKFLAVTAEPKDIMILALDRMEVVRLQGHSELPDYVSFGKKDCNKLMSCSYQETCVKLWTTEGKCWDTHKNLVLSHNVGGGVKKTRVVRAFFSCDDSLIVAISSKGIFTFSVMTGDLIACSTHEILTDGCAVLAVHPFLRDVAFVGCRSGQSAIWNVVTGDVIRIFHMDDTWCCGLREAIWSPDGQAVIASDDMAGFAVYRRSDKYFLTKELFYRWELDVMGDSTVVDRQDKEIIPQPPIINLGDIVTTLPSRKVSKAAIRSDEAMLSVFWPNSEPVPAKDYVQPTEEEKDQSIVGRHQRHKGGFGGSSDSMFVEDWSSESESTSNSGGERQSSPEQSTFTSPGTPSTRHVTSTGRTSLSRRSYSPPVQIRPRTRRIRKERTNSVSDEERRTTRSGRIVRSTLLSSSDEEVVSRKHRTKSTWRDLTPPRSFDAPSVPRRRETYIDYDSESDQEVSSRGRIIRKRDLSSDSDELLKRYRRKQTTGRHSLRFSKQSAEDHPKPLATRPKVSQALRSRTGLLSSDESSSGETRTGLSLAMQSSGRIRKPVRWSSDEETPPVKTKSVTARNGRIMDRYATDASVSITGRIRRPVRNFSDEDDNSSSDSGRVRPIKTSRTVNRQSESVSSRGRLRRPIASTDEDENSDSDSESGSGSGSESFNSPEMETPRKRNAPRAVSRRTGELMLSEEDSDTIPPNRARERDTKARIATSSKQVQKSDVGSISTTGRIRKPVRYSSDESSDSEEMTQKARLQRQRRNDNWDMTTNTKKRQKDEENPRTTMSGRVVKRRVFD